MSGPSRVVCNLGPLDALNLDIRNNRGAYVKVGILSGKKTGRKEGDLDNPNLGATHEFGSFGRKIPSRSFLRMPLSSELPHRMNAIGRDVWQAIIDKQGLRVALKKLGVHGENTVQAAFDSNGSSVRDSGWSDAWGARRSRTSRPARPRRRGRHAPRVAPGVRRARSRDSAGTARSRSRRRRRRVQFVVITTRT